MTSRRGRTLAAAERVTLQSAAEAWLIDSTLGGKYRIERVIGAGGMGAVYAAIDVSTGQRVAVKVIHAHLTADTTAAVARFEREARAAGSIDTEHIARCLDAGTDPESNNPYMVLEHLLGEDLQNLIRRLGPMPPDLSLRITAQACLGLRAAHEVGIVHRDIKPANIFLADAGEGRHIVKLLDFGVAKVWRDPSDTHGDTAGLTQTGNILGSPLYMSPEQARSVKNVDHRSDIWSMGVVLYQALAGRTPYEHISGLGDLIIALCSDLPPPVQQFAPWVAPEVAAVIDRALRIVPAERYQTIAAMLDAIMALLPDGTGIRDDMLVRLDDGARARTASTYFRNLQATPSSSHGGTEAGVGPVLRAVASAPRPEVSAPEASASSATQITESAVATTGPGLGVTAGGARKPLPMAAIAIACVIAGGAGAIALTRPGPVPAVTANLGSPSAIPTASATASAVAAAPTVTVAASATAVVAPAPSDSASARPAVSAPAPRPRPSGVLRPNRPDHTSYGDRK